MKVIIVIGDTRRQSLYPRLIEGSPHTHSRQTADPASTRRTPQTPHPQSITLYTSRTPNPPCTVPTQTTAPAPIPHPSTQPAHTTTHLAHSGPHHTPGTCRRHHVHPTQPAHTTDPALTTHTPLVHPTDPPHRPRTQPAHQTPRPPRPLAARRATEPQPQLRELPASAPPGGAGGKGRLSWASLTRTRAAEAAAANSSRPRSGPGAQHRPPPDPCRLRRAPRATPRPPPRAMPPASPAARCRLSLHSPLAAIFPSAALDRKLTAQPRPPTPTPPRPPPAL